MSKSVTANKISFPESRPNSRKSGRSPVPAWLLWVLLLILTGAAGIYSSGTAGSAGKIPFFFLLVLPLFSLQQNLTVRKHLSASFALPVHADKNQPIHGTLTLHNHGLAACGRIQVSFQIRNLLTGEISRHAAELSAPSKGRSSVSFTAASMHCGMLEFAVTDACLFDWSGLFRIHRALPASDTLLILPETFPADIRISLPYSETGEEENRNPLRGTEDPSEISSFREYRPGDPVRHIHWKLTAKRSQPILKEISRPVSRTLLVFWDKLSAPAAEAADTPAKPAGTPAEAADALAEAFASTALSLSVQEIPFMMGWRDKTGIHLEPITNEQTVSDALSQSMRSGAADCSTPDSPDPVPLPFVSEYAKTLWFSGSYPFAEESRLTQESIVFLCDSELPACGKLLTVFFRPEETEQIFKTLSV